ncbi:hypothetical protein [Frateuria terrea]|uniref:Uncharacterized protein n=1 Tax=Frateuria terrea TaxID=529704 RepID=A0A1H6ZVJ4_9GAMM|nr:hypothetical protein [Frateuria terrea]SEJ56214.1 hypothetical protein SAMN04487997_0229 [Frateuria terrea]SFP46661.1 hypothetical protein SAMN02927913_2160 [Frateuria terrea]
MSYTKLDTTFDVAAGLAALLTQNGIDFPGLADDLIAAGSAVMLDTGQTVWCSCVVHDKPETVAIDLLAVAMQLVDGAPRQKANGQIAGVATWRGVMQEHLDAWTVSTVRKACLMLALGEPQPQVPIPSSDPPPAPQVQDVFPTPAMDAANGSIRTAIAVADQLAAPLADVL